MEHANMTNKYYSLLTGTVRFRNVLSCAVLLVLGLTVGTAHAFRAEDNKAYVNAMLNSGRKVRAKAKKPTRNQLDVADKAFKSGIETEWNSRLGTPRSIRGANLGKKQGSSKLKGLTVRGGGAYKKDAIAVMDNLAPFFKIKDAEKEVAVERVDSDSLGFHHVRVKQKHKGLRVVGGDLIVHFDKKDSPYEVNGQYVSEITTEVTPGISADKAVQRAKKELKKQKLPTGELAKNPELVIYALDVEPVLAYQFTLSYEASQAGPGRWRFWINADNGEIVSSYNDIQYAEAPTEAGTAAPVYGNLLAGEGGAYTNVAGWFENNLYYLYNHDLNLLLYNNAPLGVYPDAQDYAHRDTDDWEYSDPSEISGANNLGYTLQYYTDYHGRSGFDGKGTLVTAYMHQGNNYVNAYWNSTTKAMYFGDGDGFQADSLAVLDVAGHEYSHAVTEYTADLIYRYESGALNESFSDIFGTCIEFKYQEDGTDDYPSYTPGKADWLMGEDCWLSSTALRDMRNPSNTDTVGFGNELPSRYKGLFWHTASWDNGGVHINMGVQNFFFYLLCEGGTGNNDGLDYDLTGIGITNAEQIAYRVLSVYCTPYTQFDDARRAWISAAKDLNPEWVDLIAGCWAAVGLPPPPPQQLSTPGALPNGRESAYYKYGIGVYTENIKVAWELTAGALPDGLEMDQNGVISGYSTLEGTYDFDVLTWYKYGLTTESYSITILPVHTTPYYEGFDQNNGAIPDSWEQENLTVSNSLEWVVDTSRSVNYPGEAHSYPYMICVHSTTTNNAVEVRLTTPRIDFDAKARAGRLSFNHYMEPTLTRQDDLEVYYKTALEDDWILLTNYTSSVYEWTERVIDLPQISHAVYISFVGIANNGFGVCVDSINVWDPTPPFAFITSSPLPNAIIEKPYMLNLEAEGGYGEYTYSIVSNALPVGMTLSPDGLISGVVSEVQRVYPVIQVLDELGNTLTKMFSLTVTPPVVSLLEEDFEHDGAMPVGWTQEKENIEYDTDWIITNGDGILGHPMYAHGGSLNAFLFSTVKEGDTYQTHIVRLVSPPVDLSQMPESLNLYFWHCMEEYSTSQDSLKVLYKTSAEGEWIEITSFDANTPDWTQRVVALPNPGPTYYIAFEGYARFGHGICIDDIKISNESSAPIITTERVLPPGLIDVPYDYAFAASGGVEPYSWAVADGLLPAGLSLSTDGVLSGTPQDIYLDDFFVSVTGLDGFTSTNRFNLKIRAAGRLPYFEDFENGGVMPEGWQQENVFGTWDWVLANGTSCTELSRQPVAAASGSWNLSFFVNNTTGPITKLISPMLDMGGGVSNAVLTFSHHMEEWKDDQDLLTVYYRISASNDWVVLQSYYGNTPDWTERTIPLPNLTSTYYIAFEGVANYGYGVCIDDVYVTGDLPDPYSDWLTEHFNPLEIKHGTGVGYYDDPDGDGIDNIWEYAFDLDPRVFDASGTPVGGVFNSYLQLTYRQNMQARDLDFVVEACTDLVIADWSTNDISEIVRDEMTGYWDVTAKHNFSVTNAPRRFMRLKLIQN